MSDIDIASGRIFDTFNEAYIYLLQEILKFGKRISPRPGSLGSTLEVLGADFGIPAIQPLCTLQQRKLSYVFAMLEPFYLFTTQAETDIASALMTYAPNLKGLAYNEKTEEFDGNYGDRIHLRGPRGSKIDTLNQLIRVRDVLRVDPDSRRAVVTIHNPVWDNVSGDSTDIPCTLNLHFVIRGEALHCFCTMRSNDIWYGTPHNVMMFTFLQRALAGWLNVRPGMYFHRANSLHIYEKHIDMAKKLLADRAPSHRHATEIHYPCHQSPQETYERAEAIMECERGFREQEALGFIGKSPYEIKVFEELAAFWAKKSKDLLTPHLR